MLEKLLQDLCLKASAARTSSLDPLQKFRFRLTVPGLNVKIGFQKISGLNNEIGVTEYSEGSYEYAHKLPGKPKVGELTAERGVYVENDFRSMLKKTLTDPAFRQTMTLEILDRYGESKLTYKLAEAWVSKWEGTDLDAGSDDVAIEKITIQFEYYMDA